jgi:hypothetical protein
MEESTSKRRTETDTANSARGSTVADAVLVSENNISQEEKKTHLSLVYFTGKVVFMAEKMMGGGSCWHKSCFTCLSCNKRLESTSLCEREGEIYCKSISLLFFLEMKC